MTSSSAVCHPSLSACGVYSLIIPTLLVIDVSQEKEIRSNRGARPRVPEFVEKQRGVKNWQEARPGLNGGASKTSTHHARSGRVARGKMMPSKKFTSNTSLALPSAVFMATISGGYPEDGSGFVYPEDDGDLKLMPDLSTLSVVPWETDPTAQVICDLVHQDGRFVEFTPRNVLRRVVDAYAKRGLKPVVAPEIEFYLVRMNPTRLSAGAASGRAVAPSVADRAIPSPASRVRRTDRRHLPLLGRPGLEIDTLIHEEGAGQLEINLRHGDPTSSPTRCSCSAYDREAALKHGTYATFMAKPIQGQPGSAMHIHQSIVDIKRREHLHRPERRGNRRIPQLIGGMQKHIPNALVMLAPYVNSYRRLTQAASAPVNTKWGYDNRTVAFRVPRSDPAARRVENRIPSSDANPYLALAASLACGLIGMVLNEACDQPVQSAANEDAIDLPRGI